ncbi:MAG: hypothetical protein KJ056_06425 [Acidimicrobiia bacterium]|nr:hypothetical protein [Acidimicrobiia bacterium]MCL4292650.1 hypothetical protein [Acidimicrobiia bacterium]
MNPWHLTRRFLGSLPRSPPDPADEAWAARALEPGERTLWVRLGDRDRRHLVGVARRVEVALTGTPHAGDPRWIAAALLHDAGKVEAGLGVAGRVVATLAGVAAPRRTRTWAGRPGYRGRIGRYLLHPDIGARLVREVGGRPEVAVWAEVHQDPRRHGEAGFPAEVVEALTAADDD